MQFDIINLDKNIGGAGGFSEGLKKFTEEYDWCLLIDDDAVAHKLVQYSLLSENYSLSSAYGGREGIEMLQESKYDLCLLDMEMPDVNGFEVLKWIRKNNQKIKVIFITAERDIEVIRRSEELGADDYITKPINPKILKESIKSLIRH